MIGGERCGARGDEAADGGARAGGVDDTAEAADGLYVEGEGEGAKGDDHWAWAGDVDHEVGGPGRIGDRKGLRGGRAGGGGGVGDGDVHGASFAEFRTGNGDGEAIPVDCASGVGDASEVDDDTLDEIVAG